MSDKYYLKILHFGYKNNQRFMALVVLLLSDHNDLKVVGGGERGIDVVESIGVPIRD